MMPDVKLQNAWRSHGRKYKDNRYVYPVISRRSRGISIGINLHPGKECNFDCIYCQVDRHSVPDFRTVDLDIVRQELDSILESERAGSLYEDEPFSVLDLEKRGVRDVAFSGDGEPTTFPYFEQAVQIAAQARLRFGLTSAKLVLITNAAFLHKPSVRSALARLDQNNGEIWAKLDAGSEERFRIVNRSKEPFQKILDNILDASRLRPLVIQSLWFRICNTAPPDMEIEAYCRRLNAILLQKGNLSRIQLYTVARTPAETTVSPLSQDELNLIAEAVRKRVPAPIEVF
jgi:wyosine [tRNA(Phe)-imidazoG37] synthetase (radical SAM superfamily)